ncbi:MAG: arginase family protein [Polyangiaceae bacterium]
MLPRDVLSHILAPQGIFVVTTGQDEVGQFLAKRYGTLDSGEIRERFLERLDRIASARVLLLGVPMDIGAGFERGAFKGPLGVRSQLLAKAGLYDRLEAAGVLDIGDVRVNPSLLTDDMLSAETRDAVRKARWPALDASTELPVSPLSILERAMSEIAAIAPRAKIHLVGGDHSMSMISTQALARATRNAGRTLGVVHFDAHTDLLKERDGIRCSFATWAHHANIAIGRGGRLQQLGTRISGRTRAFWESTEQVRQYWADEIADRGTPAVLDELVANLERAGVRELYISNDVDGTDPRWVAATGTMVKGGMHPTFVSAAIERLGRAFDVIGADVAELAPPLKWHVRGEPARSNQTSAHYTLAQLDALLGEPGRFAGEIAIPEPATEEEVWSLPPYA